MLLNPKSIVKEVSKYNAGKNRKNSINVHYIGRIYLPEEWIGKKVRCTLVDDYIQDSAKQTE